MNKLRKIFTISVMVLTVVVMSGALMAPNANASAQAGDLIKMDGISAVYYLGDDGKRYVFPNEATYMSWYSDFSGVVTIPASELQSYPIGGNVVMRAGVKLVKITTDPTVYAVGPDGMLHSIVSEANAIDLYGADWASMVVDVPDAFFTNYEVGSPLTVGEYPAGQLLKMEGSNDVYYFDGTDYRMFASEAAFLANNFSFDDVVTTDMSFTASGATISGFEAELFDPAQSGTTGGGDISAGTGLSVALSAATPAASTIPSGATAVPFTKFNVTASNDGEIIIDALDVKREGVGASSEISKLYIYEGDTRIGNGRTINSSTQVATFSNLNYTVPAGMTKTLTVVADIAAGDQVGNHKLGVVNASAIDASGATVSGSFPMFGNTMSLSSTDVGGVDIEGSNSYTVKTGKNNVKIGRFTVYVNNTEDGLVKSLRFYNSGRKILSNLELYRGGDMVATGTQDGDYFTFTLDNPILIEKGQSSVFTLQGDIVDARNNDIAYLYIRYSTDVEVEGQTYGYNLLPTLSINSGTSTIIDEISSTNTVQKQTITAEAGQVTLSYNGPVATNVAKNSSDVVLVDFSITAGSDVEVENTSLIIYDEDGSNDDDISNLELVCDGTIMAEWANFTEASAGTTVSDTSVWSISANDTMNCQVRVDIENTKDENDYVKASIDVDNWT
ncbi:MAG: hypothetical protein K9M44_02780, partial [Candidatus Pacebacteria bacterium]|nr:hypothetical protein [Candidatus Paceibacterota bacterium]